MKISNKISLSFLLTVVIIITAAGSIYYTAAKNNLKSAIFGHLTTAAQSRAEHIETFLEVHRHVVDLLAARIVGLVDVFDALTSKRPYKDPFPVEVALDIIKKDRGEHFDPDVVDVFLENIHEILKIKEEVGLKEDLSLTDFTKSKRDQPEG